MKIHAPPLVIFKIPGGIPSGALISIVTKSSDKQWYIVTKSSDKQWYNITNFDVMNNDIQVRCQLSRLINFSIFFLLYYTV